MYVSLCTWFRLPVTVSCCYCTQSLYYEVSWNIYYLDLTMELSFFRSTSQLKFTTDGLLLQQSIYTFILLCHQVLFEVFHPVWFLVQYAVMDKTQPGSKSYGRGAVPVSVNSVFSRKPEADPYLFDSDEEIGSNKTGSSSTQPVKKKTKVVYFTNLVWDPGVWLSLTILNQWEIPSLQSADCYIFL